MGRQPRRDRRVLARLRDAVAAGLAAPKRPAAATCRRAIRGQSASGFRDPLRQRVGGRAGRCARGLARHRDQPGCTHRLWPGAIGSFGPPAYPGIPSYAPNLTEARGHATMIANAMGELRKVAPEPAAYRPLNWLTASRVLPRAAGWTAATLCHGSLLWSPFRVPGGRVAVPARGENRAPPTGAPFENQ